MECEARVALKPTLDQRRLVGRGVVEHHVHVELGRHRGIDQVEEAANSSARLRGEVSAITWPEATSSAA